MAIVGLVVHQGRPQATDVAREITRWLQQNGHEVRFSTQDAATAGLDELGYAPRSFVEQLDLAVSLGGDGTMLRTVELVAAEGVPVLGVNLGQLGYLTEIEPPGLQDALASYFDGRFAIERRMLLTVHIEDPSGGVSIIKTLALNEAVLQKTASGHMARLDVEINGESFTTYEADGLIIATPTGSTAYAFSARGPIIEPTHRALLMTPVSPHMLFDRSLVLEPSTFLRIAVAGHRPASLAIDGRPLGELGPGDAIACTASEYDAQLVMFRPRNFHRILKAKFGLSDR